MKHLKNILGGVGTVFAPLVNPRTYYIEHSGFANDRKNLQSDVNQVMNNLNAQTQKTYQSYVVKTR